MCSFDIRQATPADLDEILDVCGVSLGWDEPDFDRSLFRWKHEENAFGRSLIMVAESSGGIAAVRPFMSWRFRRGTETMTAARAVDTATHPQARGQGLFRTLTETGLEVLRDSDVGIIFNTPNDNSRPGYLKMGWKESGQISFAMSPRAVSSLPRIARARIAAEKVSLPLEAGLDVAQGVNHAVATSNLPSSQADDRWVTDHDLASLLWRFDSGPITYRWIPGPSGTGQIVRARKRGPAVEVIVAAVIGSIDPRPRTAGARFALRRAGGDYLLGEAGAPSMVTTAQIGPTLTVRAVNATPEPTKHRWEPGDIELF